MMNIYENTKFTGKYDQIVGLGRDCVIAVDASFSNPLLPSRV